MTTIRVSLVDLYVLRGRGRALECLVLRRGPGGRCPRSWEVVHGHIEDGERPFEAAIREMREETGLAPDRLYNLSRVETFYQHGLDEVALVPAFAAFVEGSAPISLSAEHEASEWLSMADARERVAWPREARALADIERMLGNGDGGAIDDVLRIAALPPVRT